MPFPWLVDLNKKLQSYTEEHFAIVCSRFAAGLVSARVILPHATSA